MAAERRTHWLCCTIWPGGGAKANNWKGVRAILDKARLTTIPEASIAIFVGQKFDPRGGNDGTPLRRTPWGEIAWQLGGHEAYKIMEKFDEEGRSPGGDTIARLFSKEKPTLILIDELLNYVSRYRDRGMSSQLYNFLQNLTEEARSFDNVVVAVSIPASELEMNPEDQADYSRFKKMLDRLGKAVIMSAEDEVSEIIRRRLFEWDGVPDDARKVASEYAAWVVEHKQQIPQWFPVDSATEAFVSSYPIHPMALSVFQRKWQALPRFQQTRGILRLFALWVSRAYQDRFEVTHKEPLITLGTAPLEDSTFRAAMFEQLGESRLEGALTTDIAGKKDSHAIRLDNEAVDAIKKAGLHRKVASTIFFESNGGQAKAEATLPEIRLAVAEPGLDIGNVETVLEALTEACYFLSVEKTRYRFSLVPNLNKLLADRRASIQLHIIEERVKYEVQYVFSTKMVNLPYMERIYFPEKSIQVADRAVLTFVVLSPEQSLPDEIKMTQFVDRMTREHGGSARTFKSALIWCVPDDTSSLFDETRKVLAWEDIDAESDELNFDETQKHHLSINLKKAGRDLKETIWRTYNKVMLLGKDNAWHIIDLGLVHSSSAESLIVFILNRLRQEGHVEEGISPNFLTRNWPPAFKEWSTKSVMNAFFASPQFPRLLNPDSIRETISRGVANGMLAYVGKKPDGGYEPFYFDTSISSTDIEISDDMFIIPGEEAKKHIEPPKLTRLEVTPSNIRVEPGDNHGFLVKAFDQHNRQMDIDNDIDRVSWNTDGGTIDEKGVFKAGDVEGTFKLSASIGTLSVASEITVSKEKEIFPPEPVPVKDTFKKMYWNGEIQAQKWMNFYTKVLSQYATGNGLKLTLKVEIASSEGVSKQKVEDTKIALKELGLDDKIDTE